MDFLLHLIHVIINHIFGIFFEEQQDTSVAYKEKNGTLSDNE